MSRTLGTMLKFGAFAGVMVVLTGFLFMIFGQYRTGAAEDFTATFANVSELKTGDSVRAAGLRVGTVTDVRMQSDRTVRVGFTADRGVVLTTGTRAVVRYLNLVGDRFLELVDGPGSTRILPAGSNIPTERTAPALDLDQLVGGLKPVIQGLNPQDVNALTASLLQVFQGQGGTLKSLLTESASFTDGLAQNSQTIQRLIDNLNLVVETLSADGDNFSGAIDKLTQLVSQLSTERDPIAEAIDALDKGTASIADLLTDARPPLAGTVDQLARLAPLVDDDKERLDNALQRAPGNYRKLVRLGAYGSWINYYICGFTIRVTDLQGRTAAFPWFKQEGGRCAEP
ncbi:MCE family protein [Mycobacterium sp. 48b]|uniref:MCE family protein n=1 Tax=Mycobacterium sp. 48b TaxID=3400426 RepID=UPI003AAA4256